VPDRTASKAKVNKSSRGSDAPSATRKANGTAISADRYVPGLVRTVANRLEGGASRFYRKHYSIGLSEWHILVALAADPWITTPVLCANAGLDKAAVSRSLARMEEEGFVLSRNTDGRSRAVGLTAKGRRLHDRIAQAATAREVQLLADFSPKEVDTLVSLLSALSKAAAGLTDAPAKAPRRRNASAGE
jgi:DNA-binding MarR family transcriptional regulator